MTPLGGSGGANGIDAGGGTVPETGASDLPATASDATPEGAGDARPPEVDGAAPDRAPAMDAPGTTDGDGTANPVWQGLANPIYTANGWSTKDVGVFYGPTGTIHVYFSAFFADAGQERCHVAQTTSKDLRTFTPAVVVFDGQADGWIGMCSPDVQKIGNQYVMTFNAWGDQTPKPKQLFYSTSTDLTTWGPMQPLGASLTAGRSYIDAALANPGDGRLFLFYKDDSTVRTRLAAGPALDGPWHTVGNGFPSLLMPSGSENGLVHENYQLLQIDGKWRLLSTDYSPRDTYIYTLRGTGAAETDWLTWEAGFRTSVKREAFNSNETVNAAYIVDRRPADGFFYLYYAGRTEAQTHLGRGNNKIAVSRSMDMRNWIVAGQ
jgi:hypothetical protein